MIRGSKLHILFFSQAYEIKIITKITNTSYLSYI